MCGKVIECVVHAVSTLCGCCVTYVWCVCVDISFGVCGVYGYILYVCGVYGIWSGCEISVFVYFVCMIFVV